MAQVIRDHTIVIAEIGVNHNGSLDLAKQLIDAAVECGADYAKFQTYRADQLVSEAASLADYQKQSSSHATQRELLATLELGDDVFLELKDYCETQGIGFLTTAHDEESADFVFALELDYVKIPSGDVTNFPFLERVSMQPSPILMSTGMATEEEVGEALAVLQSGSPPREDITVLQCTTEYPAALEDTNLRAMVRMGAVFGISMGYSDHTAGIEASLAAVAMGAIIIEKHLTLDKTMVGPDHSASADPEEFAQMVTAIRKIEIVIGGFVKEPSAVEKKNKQSVRKSIVAKRLISKGELFSAENLIAKRPGTGLSPMRWRDVVGQKSDRDYTVDENIELP
jgi:N,N'-diacetyllegionaminate synthase